MSVAGRATREVMLPRKTFWKQKEAKAETWRIFNAQAGKEESKKMGVRGRNRETQQKQNKQTKHHESSEFQVKRLREAPRNNPLDVAMRTWLER